MSKVIVFGAGQWAELAHFYLTHDSPYDVVAFTLDRDYMKASEFKGLPVVAYDVIEQEFPPTEFKMFIPLSFNRMNHARAEKYHDARKRGYELISYVSTKATTFPGFACGDNCFILENNTIQPFVTIGSNVVMWSGNHIGHHSVVRDHVMVTSHVVISGSCTIEPFCFLGVNAAVRDATVIARETLVGMGVTIVKDTKEFEVYRELGTPLASIRSDQLRRISYKPRG